MQYFQWALPRRVHNVLFTTQCNGRDLSTSLLKPKSINVNSCNESVFISFPRSAFLIIPTGFCLESNLAMQMTFRADWPSDRPALYNWRCLNKLSISDNCVARLGFVLFVTEMSLNLKVDFSIPR